MINEDLVSRVIKICLTAIITLLLLGLTRSCYAYSGCGALSEAVVSNLQQDNVKPTNKELSAECKRLTDVMRTLAKINGRTWNEKGLEDSK